MTPFAERAARGVRPFTEADLPDLQRFQAEMYASYRGTLASARIDWLDAAVRPTSSPATTALWICHREGRIVGQQAQIPLSLKVKGDDVPGAAAIELMVDPAWRLKGVGPALARAQRSSTRVSIALGLSEEARRMYVGTGWFDLGKVTRAIVAVRPLRAIMAGTGSRRQAMLGCLWPAAEAVYAYGVAQGRRLTRRTRAEEVRGFNERSEIIWRESSPYYDVLARRDRATLRWRFDECPQAHAYRRFYVLRGEHPVGYLVVRSAQCWGMPSLRIVDYLSPPPLLPVLLAHACQLARKDSVALVEARSRNAPAARYAARNGYGYGYGFRSLPRLEARVEGWPGITMMAYASDDDPARASVSEPGSWFLTSADSDVDLWP